MNQMTKGAKETAELLRCAADHLDRVGLHKGDYFKGLDRDHEHFDVDAELAIELGHGDFKNAKCCAYGALYACATDEDQVERAGSALVNFGANHGYKLYSLDDWSDVKHRRKGDVVMLFRKAAQELDPK